MTKPKGRPATAKAKVLTYYAGRPGHKTDAKAAAELGMSSAAFGNARRALEHDGLLTVTRVPQPRQGGRDRVLVSLRIKKTGIFRAILAGRVDVTNGAFSEPCHYRVYKALGPQVPRTRSPGGQNMTRLRKGKSVKGGGMKFIVLDRADGPPANLARVGEVMSEKAPSVLFIKLFCSEYRKRFGTRYLARPEDRRHAKRLTDAHELSLLEEMVRLFVAMDGYGRPSIRHFYTKSAELLVGARERISDRAKDRVESDRMTPEERQEYKIREISDAMFYGTVTDEQREEARQLVAGWSLAKCYARHTQEVVRAATTDEQWERHVAERERYRTEKWRQTQS